MHSGQVESVVRVIGLDHHVVLADGGEAGDAVHIVDEAPEHVVTEPGAHVEGVERRPSARPSGRRTPRSRLPG